MSVFGLAKSQPAEPAQKGHVLVWPPEHFTVVYTLCSEWVTVENESDCKRPKSSAAVREVNIIIIRILQKKIYYTADRPLLSHTRKVIFIQV